MAYIKVNHTSFATTAAVIDEYIDLMKQKMKGADVAVEGLAATWEGADFAQFKTEWERVTAEDSTYRSMIKTFETYSGYLKHVGEKYKETQARAVNRANGLPKY